jgi:hypothetical protein
MPATPQPETPPEPPPAAAYRMTFQPGGERTEPEYAALLATAGFRLESVTDIHWGQCLIVGVPVS